ncbi:hypothetical protein GH733_000098 [Mirounga leonina]|nr:hypothetical protein GH733_000098 [Mirounga leonina]
MDGRVVTPAGALRPCDPQTSGWGRNAAPRAMLNSDLLGDFFLQEPSSPDRAGKGSSKHLPDFTLDGWCCLGQARKSSLSSLYSL